MNVWRKGSRRKGKETKMEERNKGIRIRIINEKKKENKGRKGKMSIKWKGKEETPERIKVEKLIEVENKESDRE